MLRFSIGLCCIHVSGNKLNYIGIVPRGASASDRSSQRRLHCGQRLD